MERRFRLVNIKALFYIFETRWTLPYIIFSYSDRKLIKLPNNLHHNPKCCFILKDDPVEWLKTKDEIEKNTDLEALGQFEVIQLKEYRKRTKGAIKRRKFLKDFDLLIADNRIREAFYMQSIIFHILSLINRTFWSENCGDTIKK